MDWVTGIGRAIDYIEAHLTEEIDYEEVARQAYSSSYHFQRVFSVLCGYTLGEYIRKRRLTLAGAALLHSESKIIDVALQYGYESPDSFSRGTVMDYRIEEKAARIYTGSGYALADGAEIAVIHWYQKPEQEKRYIELWLPVTKN
jgi:AraC family transcriptional regulator